MREMCPFKRRYLLLFVPIIIFVILCVIKTNAKYGNIKEYKYSLGDEIVYKGMGVKVKEAQLVDGEYIHNKYVDNDMVLSIYEEKYTASPLLMITLDVKGINNELYMDMLGAWQAVVGVNGNGVAFMTDCANGDFTDAKEDKEISLFFKLSDEWLENNNEIKVMTDLYPEQHNIYIDLGK